MDIDKLTDDELHVSLVIDGYNVDRATVAAIRTAHEAGKLMWTARGIVSTLPGSAFTLRPVLTDESINAGLKALPPIGYPPPGQQAMSAVCWELIKGAAGYLSRWRVKLATAENDQLRRLLRAAAASVDFPDARAKGERIAAAIANVGGTTPSPSEVLS